jgi:hypothetical protein
MKKGRDVSYSPPMIGQWGVTVHDARPYHIHGDSYFELVVEPDDAPGKGMKLKVPAHAVAAGEFRLPAKATVTMLMGQVTGVSFTPGGQP